MDYPFLIFLAWLLVLLLCFYKDAEASKNTICSLKVNPWAERNSSDSQSFQLSPWHVVWRFGV
jgi:hypothetical protein